MAVVLYRYDGASCVQAVGKVRMGAAWVAVVGGSDEMTGRFGFVGRIAKGGGACCVARCGISDEVNGFIFIPEK